MIFVYIYCVSLYQQKQKDMNTQTLKAKVIAQLIKWGNNENDVIEMVNLHFELAAKKHSTIKEIAIFIRTIY